MEKNDRKTQAIVGLTMSDDLLKNVRKFETNKAMGRY